MIKKCIKPVKSYKQLGWCYNAVKLINGQESTPIQYDIDESDIYPDCVFQGIATDATRMKIAPFTEALNSTYEGKALILGVYRNNQLRPWAYYVLPDRNALWDSKENKQKSSEWDTFHMVTVRLLKKSYKRVKFISVSSKASEILTYLGLHVYSGRWKTLDA